MLLRYEAFSSASDAVKNYDLKHFLKESTCFFWFSKEIKESEWLDIFYDNIFISNIFVAIWLKYWDNSQVIEDFWKIVENHGNDSEYATLVAFCHKYGRKISIKYIITAYNLCLMFAFQYTSYHFCYDILKHIKLDKNFVNNATANVKDLTFDDFITEYNIESESLPSDYEFYDEKVGEFLEKSLDNVRKISFTNCCSSDIIMPYFSGKCVTNIAKIALSKPLGLQILYVATMIGNVLTYYFCEYRRKSGEIDAENIAETHYEQLVNNVENILNKMVVNNNDLTIISNYLELVNKSANNALGQILDLAIYDHNQSFSLKTPYNNPVAGLRDQKDGTAVITRIRKLCRLLDPNIANQLTNTPYDMWQAVLDAKIDKFDEIVDDFYNAIINCGIMANRSSTSDATEYAIIFSKKISPDYFMIKKFNWGSSSSWDYYIPLYLNFYEYFDTIGFSETNNMLKLREKCVEELETCLTNMQKLLDKGELNKHIEKFYW